MWLCNKILEKQCFSTKYVSVVDKYVSDNPSLDISSFIRSDKYDSFK